MKVYCETGALLKEIKQLAHTKQIELVHFPYDDSSSRQLGRAALATPSSMARLDDMNISWDEARAAGHSWDETKSPAHYEEIKAIIGAEHRIDILHVHSAYKSGCAVFVTRDRDIHDHKTALEVLLGMKIFHADKDRDELLAFLGP